MHVTSLRIDIHLLRNHLPFTTQILDRDVPPYILLRNDLLIQPRRRALLEPVTPLLLPTLVRLDVVPQQLRRLVLFNHARIHVTPGPQIVENSCLDRLFAQLQRVILGQLRPPHRLEHAHRSQRARSHRHVRKLISRTVRVHSEQVHAGGIHACHDEVRPDVALVPEEVLLEHGHAGHDAGLAAGREGVQLDVRSDQGGCEFGVCGCAGARAPDLGRDVVEFLAVLCRVLVSGDRTWGSFWSGRSIPYRQRWDRLWLLYLRQSVKKAWLVGCPV